MSYLLLSRYVAHERRNVEHRTCFVIPALRAAAATAFWTTDSRRGHWEGGVLRGVLNDSRPYPQALAAVGSAPSWPPGGGGLPRAAGGAEFANKYADLTNRLALLRRTTIVYGGGCGST
jgi:hypothetical protein